MNTPDFFKRKESYPFLTVMLVSVFVLTVWFPKTASAKAAAANKIQVDLNGVTKKYSDTGQTVILDGETISTKKMPSVKINSTWMVSVTDVFEKGLGCTYQYDDAANRVTLTNPNTDVSVSFTPGSREVSVTGEGEDEEDKNSSESLPYPAVPAKNISTGNTGLLVPVSFLAQKLGFHYSYRSSGDTIALKTAAFLDRDVVIPEYDRSVYSNVLTTVLIEQNSAATREELTLITSNATDERNVLVEENEAAGMYTYTFINTYNAVGEIQKTFSASFIKKLTVVTSERNVVVTVSFRNQCHPMTLLEEDGVTASFSSASYSLKLHLPDSVTFSQVEDTDLYMKNQFVLQIPGNWKNFYKDHPVIANNSVIKRVTVSASSDQTYITVTTKRLQGYLLTEDDGFFTVRIDDPRKIYRNIVVLDAGHGGRDNGTTNRGTKEKNLNYIMIYSKAKEYFDSKDSNIKAYWTRTDDTFITLSDRAKFASTVGADLFISLHMNSCSKPSINGMEIYYSKDNNRSVNSGLTSQLFARKMLNKLTEELNAPSRGVKNAGFYVIKYNTVPAILIELGFLSGTSDYHKLTSDSYQNRAVESIYECTESVFAKYPTGR